jgi:hypothetical protein
MNIIFNIYLLLLFTIFLNGVRRIKKYSTPFKILILLIGLTFLSELSSRFLADKFHNSMPVYHVFSVVEYVCLTAIYVQLLPEGIMRRLEYLQIPIISYALINSIFIQHFWNFPTNSIVVFQIIYLGYSLLGLKKILEMPRQISILKESFFWLNTSLLMFSSTQLLSLGLINYGNRHHLNLNPVFVVSSLINLIYYSFWAMSLYFHKINSEKSLLNEGFGN